MTSHGEQTDVRALSSGRFRVVALLACAMAASPAAGAAQTITGTLADLNSDRPIPLGLVMMYTESGDSISATITDGGGRFSLTSPEPGSFVLRAAALGYRETPAGVFELGADATMNVEYRLRPEPLPIDALLVQLDRPALQHHLVRNGFVRRLQRGLGKFITPHAIEQSSARSTESLLVGIPSVRVGIVNTPIGNGTEGLLVPATFLGETVQIAGPTGGWCEPTVYVDGMRIHYDPDNGWTLSNLAHIGDVDAIEVYRRPAEIPVEFSNAQQQSFATAAAGRQPPVACGVLVVWTKQGLAAGQRGDSGEPDRIPEGSTLPSVKARGEAPRPGETIRMTLLTTTVDRTGVASPWQGTFVALNGPDLIGSDASTGRAIAVPIQGIDALQVQRRKGSADAIRRGAIAGTVLTLGMYGFLELMCGFSCGELSEQQNFWPSVGAGLFAGGLVFLRGPGNHWVEAPPGGAGPPSSQGAFDLGIRLPPP